MSEVALDQIDKLTKEILERTGKLVHFIDLDHFDDRRRVAAAQKQITLIRESFGFGEEEAKVEP